MDDEFHVDLVELHRLYAAFTNPACHFDLCGMEEVARWAALDDLREQIETALIIHAVENWDRSA
jgi:hypothetical protein